MAGRALLAALITDSQNFVDFYQFERVYGFKMLHVILWEDTEFTLDFISRPVFTPIRE